MPAATKASVRKGILAGGNWIVDQVKMIDVYPQREQLANITGAAITGTGSRGRLWRLSTLAATGALAAGEGMVLAPAVSGTPVAELLRPISRCIGHRRLLFLL